jgi:hypothetical protein
MSAGTPLTKHELRTPFAYLVHCDYCDAEPRHRCVGAESHPDGYPSTIHEAREEALWDLVAKLIAGSTTQVPQVAEIYAKFKNPSTQEVRRAIAGTILVPEERH